MPTNTLKDLPFVYACTFQREKDGPWEWGFDINGKTVCDSNGEIVTNLWDIRDYPHRGTMTLPTII